MFVALALLAACAQPGGSPDESASGTSRPVISVPPPETLPSDEGEPVTGEVPEDMLAAIVADAARQTGIGEEQIEVTRAEAVTWNDGSLGCPEPDTAYTQALVDGYHVVLDVDGEPLDYRVDSAGGFRICEGPSRPSG